MNNNDQTPDHNDEDLENYHFVSYEQGAKDLDQLITMAEEVSKKVTDINERIARIKHGLVYALCFSVLSVVLSFYLNALSKTSILDLSLIAIVISLGMFSVVLIFVWVGALKIKSLSRSKYLEMKILRNLFVMIHEYKSYIHTSNTSPVEKAIIDMRLQRIEYSGHW
ncbi:hypothetical protein NA644_20325 [Pseudomonas stutzeri]|uniref:Uncharacterized protein n=1 Tax=Stutzerimonas stutzeri TaxID=316 RepID=A0A2N8SLL8_STUST|nr:hypothetical protein [Stutzerimonas stutzeri]MCQ4251657.1 hypothetical protein [Stutzerimonas stutzeri]PNG03400.1 hypothetical protein CXL00_19685 [Stutzerimonas stutzeri]